MGLELEWMIGISCRMVQSLNAEVSAAYRLDCSRGGTLRNICTAFVVVDELVGLQTTELVDVSRPCHHSNRHQRGFPTKPSLKRSDVRVAFHP